MLNYIEVVICSICVVDCGQVVLWAFLCKRLVYILNFLGNLMGS